MSKTIRRKNKNGISNYVGHIDESVYNNKIKYKYLDYYEYNKKYAGNELFVDKEFIKDLNKYHTDSNVEYTAPKRFRKQKNREFRNNCNRIIKNLNNNYLNVNIDNLIFPLHKKVMEWDWF
jgi:hypothetical protein